MSTTTTNLSLTKPDGTDYVDIDDINGNMDTIDAAVGAVPVATKGSLQSQVDSNTTDITSLRESINLAPAVSRFSVNQISNRYFEIRVDATNGNYTVVFDSSGIKVYDHIASAWIKSIAW